MTAAPFPSTQQASGRHVLPRLVLQQLAGQAVTGTGGDDATAEGQSGEGTSIES